MKRIAVVAIASVAAIMAFALIGCTNVETQPQSEQEQQIDEQPSKQNQAAEYVERVGTDSFSEIGDGIDAILEAIEADDIDSAQSEAMDVEKKCNRIIDMTEIPEIAERPHGYMVEAASAYKDAAVSYAMAPMLKQDGRIEDAAECIKEGNESIDRATESLDMATDAIRDMKRQAAE